MKRTLVLALAAGLATSTLAAQTAPAPAPAAAAPAPVAAPPQAIPAKIAIIAFQSGMVNTNEGARTVDDIQKKYAPQKAKIDTEAAEVESLRKQLAALAANAPDDQRAKLTIDIDTKEKQLNLDAESAQTSYNTDLQKAFGELQQKFGTAAVKYCNDNGFTMLVTPESSQNSPNPILWWTPTIDITQAVINAYNASSGIAAPPPSAPKPRPTAPHATTPAAPRRSRNSSTAAPSQRRPSGLRCTLTLWLAEVMGRVGNPALPESEGLAHCYDAPMVPPLETARLILRPLALADAEQVQRIFPHWGVVEFLANHVPWPYPGDGVLTYYRDAALPAVVRGEEWHWTIRLKSAPEQIIGAIGLFDNAGNNRGFWLGVPWQRQGLMPEAVDVVTDFWFNDLGFAVLRVPKAIANRASRRISEQTGMRIVGVEEKDYVSGRLPTEIWEITAEEWRSHRRSNS